MKKLIFAIFTAFSLIAMSLAVFGADFDTIASKLDNTEFNKDMADYLAQVCINTRDSQIITQMLEEDGFTDIKTYYYYSNDKDNSAFCIAKKTVDGNPVVLLSVKQTSDVEWYGNFNIADNGENPYHESFYKAAVQTLKAFDSYVDTQFDVQPKVIITGYSRGAAVANIIAAALDKRGGLDMCAYTFATPAVTTLTDTGDSKFDNIFNIINPEDFVTVAPLKEWGFSRYGRDYVLPSAIKDANYYDMLPNMMAVYKKMTNNTYTPFEDDSTQVYSKQAYDLAPTLDDYYNKRYRVPGYGDMSLREYLDRAAVLMCSSSTTDEKYEVYEMMRLMDGTYFQLLTNYLYDNYMNGKLLNSHDIYTYSSWLSVLDGEYFKAQELPKLLFGDVTCDGVLGADDSANILQKAIDASYKMPVEAVTDDFLSVADIDGDGTLSAADSAYVLQKVIDSSFSFGR